MSKFVDERTQNKFAIRKSTYAGRLPSLQTPMRKQSEQVKQILVSSPSRFAHSIEKIFCKQSGGAPSSKTMIISKKKKDSQMKINELLQSRRIQAHNTTSLVDRTQRYMSPGVFLKPPTV